MREGLKQRLEAALIKDNTIVVDKKEVGTCKGFSEQYLGELGITKADLKRLERAGMALKGLTQNIFTKGQSMPNGKIVEDNDFVSYRGDGHRKRWILIAKGD